jgi:hypothetical protein
MGAHQLLDANSQVVIITAGLDNKRSPVLRRRDFHGGTDYAVEILLFAGHKRILGQRPEISGQKSAVEIQERGRTSAADL